MAKFTVTGPDGREIELEGDTPPSEQELDQIFKSAPAKTDKPAQSGKSLGAGTPLDLAPMAADLINKGVSNSEPLKEMRDIGLPIFTETMKRYESARVQGGEALPAGPLGAAAEAVDNPEKLMEGIKKTAGAIAGKPEDQKEFGDVLREKGVPEPLAALGGLAANMATDPLSYLGMGEGKAAIENLPVKATDAVIADTPSAIKFNLNPAKTIADYDSEISRIQDALVKAPSETEKTVLAEQLDNLNSEKVVNEMSDFKNNRIRRTPDAMSLMTTYIEQRGQFGAALARQIDRASNTLDGLRAKWLSRFDSQGDLNRIFARLDPEERVNLMAAKEGYQQATDPKLEKILEIMKTNDAEIAENAIKRGMTVNTSDGVKPFAPRENYIPHFLLSPKQVLTGPQSLADAINYQVKIKTFKSYEEGFKVWESYREALTGSFEGVLPKPNAKTKDFYEWLVKNGQAPNEDQAWNLFRKFREKVQSPKFNNLEYAREINIPFYDVDPVRVLTRHYSGVAKRFGEIDAFGRNGEIANKLISGIAEEVGPKDAQNIMHKLNLITGAERPSELLQGPSRVIRNIEAASKLGLAVVVNATQSINTTAVTGFKNAAQSILEAFTKEGKDFAFKSGSIFNEFTQSMYGIGDHGITAKIASEVLDKTGFSSMERMNRVIAAVAGKHFAEDMSRQLVAGEGKTLGAVQAAKALRRMGIRPETVLANGGLADEDLMQAARSVVTRTQFRARIQDSPEWAIHPVGKVFNQFKNFTENQWKFLREELVNEAKSGNFAPILRYAVVSPAAGEAQKHIKGLITGKDPINLGDTMVERLIDDAASVGALGLLYDVIKSVQYKGPSWVGAMSSGIEDIGRTSSNVYQAVKPLIDHFMGEDEVQMLNLKPLTRQIAESIPVVGPRIVEAMKSPQEKKRAATQKLREAIESNADVRPLLKMMENKGIDTAKVLKNAESVILKKKHSGYKQELELQRAKAKGDYLTAALMQLGLHDSGKK
jgi:antitoxin component HigA of HigAB toxin-antitoxin module